MHYPDEHFTEVRFFEFRKDSIAVAKNIMKYDVVIIGAGTAGCVLGARLSEDRKRSVLVLEAGPDYPDFDNLPDDLKYSYTNAAARKGAPHDWGYVGTATPNQTKPMMVPRARVVGGSGTHNGPGPNFWRGVPEDYDDWAAAGNYEWSYTKVLPYFRKLETDLDIHNEYHGSSGPIPVRRHKRETWLPFQAATYQACIDAGFPEHPDVNHPDYTGVAPRVENNLDGIRMSTALRYLNPNRHRPNLSVKADTLARRIVFDDSRATGVEVESGNKRTLIEGEEIILSAGAVASPQLLMLSGVGPRDHLRSLGISVTRDLPGVGQNMRDHFSVAALHGVRYGFPQDPHAPRNQICLCYTAKGSSTRNDMLVTPTSFATDVPNGGDPMKSVGVALGTSLYLPIGAGELTLTSADPHAHPYMDFRYLSESWDRQRLRQAVRLCIRLLEHPGYNDIITDRISPTDEDLVSDDALDLWLLRNVTTSYHVSGTCKMGPTSDPFAVTDQSLRVHGLQKLRVVDASIMPNVIRANTNATTIMIAERASDLIKAQI